MADEIINRVASSKLKTIDLEDFYPDGKRILIDLKDWLYEGLVLREKDFRNALKSHDWSLYNNAYVAVNCSTDAIIPAWAFMLISVYLEPHAKIVVIGDLNDLETSLYQRIIHEMDVSEFKDLPVIIKGCANKPVPTAAYVMITNKLRPIAKSIMYGEACSSVPLYKNTT